MKSLLFFHLKSDTFSALLPGVTEDLIAGGIPLDPGDAETKPVIIGESFANEFGRRLRKSGPDRKPLRILCAQGGAERVSNSLFLFPNEYLEDTSAVVWLVPCPLLASNSMPPLVTNPDTGSGKARPPSLTVISSLGWDHDRSAYRDRLERLPYPDALVEIVAEVTDGSEKDPERIVLYGPGIEDRRPLPLSHLQPGRPIAANLIPFESYVAANPAIAHQYIINNEAPFTLKRYWIHSWTYLR